MKPGICCAVRATSACWKMRCSCTAWASTAVATLTADVSTTKPSCINFCIGSDRRSLRLAGTSMPWTKPAAIADICRLALARCCRSIFCLAVPAPATATADDEEALAAAMPRGMTAGAGWDVFEQ